MAIIWCNAPGTSMREIFSNLNFTVLEVKDEILPPLVGLSDGEEKRKLSFRDVTAIRAAPEK